MKCVQILLSNAGNGKMQLLAGTIPNWYLFWGTSVWCGCQLRGLGFFPAVWTGSTMMWAGMPAVRTEVSGRCVDWSTSCVHWGEPSVGTRFSLCRLD